MTNADRYRAYLAKCPGAVAGQSGHATTFAVCCRGIEFGLSPDEALPPLLEWNERCQPPWSDRELRRKLNDASKRTCPKLEFAGTNRSPSATATARTVARNSAPAASSPPTIPAALDLRPFNLTAGNDGERAMLAALRHVSIAAVALMAKRGLLRFGTYRQRPAWFVLDTRQRFTVVRRMDGELWRVHGEDRKSLVVTTDPKANGNGVWPIGVMESRNYSCVALVEGGPDFLAAHEIIVREGREQDCAAVMMFSSSPPIHADALPYFTRKRGRIFTHTDDNGAGEKAATKWTAQLESVGAIVDGYHCGNAMGKDLNDLARLHGFSEKILP